MAEVNVGHEILCPSGKELVWGCEVPRDATDVSIPIRGGVGDGTPGRVTTRAVEDEVVEGMSGPAAGTRELVQGDVRPETGRVVQCEGMPHGKAEGGGGGVPWVLRHTTARVGVFVGSDSCRPKGVVGAVGWMKEGVFVSPGGGARGGTPLPLPVLSPEGEGALTSDSLGVRHRLYPVKGSAGGKAACREGFEPRRIVRDPEPLGW